MKRILQALAVVVALIAGNASSASADPTPLKILAIGDSNTEGAGGHGFLVDRLAAAGYTATVVNKGVGGWACVNMTVNAAAWVAEVRPDYVLLSCGTNDGYSSAFVGNYRALVNTILGADPHAKVIWSWLAYSNVGPEFLGGKTAWLADSEPAVNDGIYRWAASVGALNGSNPRIPAFADFQDVPAQFRSVDGLHFTAGGHDIRQRKWFNALMVALDRADRAPLPCGMVRVRPGWPTYPVRQFTPCETVPAETTRR